MIRSISIDGGAAHSTARSPVHGKTRKNRARVPIAASLIGRDAASSSRAKKQGKKKKKKKSFTGHYQTVSRVSGMDSRRGTRLARASPSGDFMGMFSRVRAHRRTGFSLSLALAARLTQTRFRAAISVENRARARCRNKQIEVGKVDPDRIADRGKGDGKSPPSVFPR